MLPKEILEQAITKAIAGGWISPLMPEWSVKEIVKGGEYDIFNHEFAKALWGNHLKVAGFYKHNIDNGNTGFILEGWQYHLQQMVIADDPIQYLGDNI